MCIICENKNPETGEYNMVVLNNLTELNCRWVHIPYESSSS